MQAHEERVIKEAEELEIKVSKLNEFVTRSPAFQLLEETDQVLLSTQSAAMATYLGILLMRIDRFKK